MQQVRVKICGLRTAADVAAVAAAGAGYAGFVFFPKSPRHLTVEVARDLALGAPEGLCKVALTVDADDTIPTNSNSDLGNRNWGLGPSVVVLHLDKGDPWVYGVLANNIWSLSDSGSGGSYNNGLIQPFVNYNFPGGFYVTSAPIITVNWKADSSQRWTVPLGGGVGKIFHLGRLPVNTQLSAYYNVVTPDNGPNWQIRAQVQFMFPK